MSSLPASMKKIRLKMKALECSEHFPIITLCELSVAMDTRVPIRSGPKPNQGTVLIFDPLKTSLMDSVSLMFHFFINLRSKFRKLSSPLIVFHMASPKYLLYNFSCFLKRLKQDALSSFDINKRTLFRFVFFLSL